MTGRAHAALEAAFTEHWGRLLALLAARFRRLDLAEDGLAEAYASASARWVVDGVPTNPAAWLLTAARRSVLDRLRTEAVAQRKQPLLVVDAEVSAAAAAVLANPGGIVTDERLRLLFLGAHPALAPDVAAAVTLRLVLGVPTADVARLFHVGEGAMAARLTRAKRKLAVAGVPFAVPEGAALEPRLRTVLEVIYLAFTAGYAPGSGAEVVRVELAGEAIRLARVLRELLPTAEGDALLALMLLQHARRDARTDPDGRLVLLPDQDRTRWSAGEIAEGLDLLVGLPAEATSGRYALQAAIAAEHAVAPTSDATRWDRIAARYAELEALTGSPVVRLNRAVAVAEADGPGAGLAVLDGLAAALPHSHRVPAVQGALLTRLGRTSEARAAYELALARCGNAAEAAALADRLAELG